MDRLLTPSKITAWLDCAHFLTLQHQLDAGTLVVERSPFGEMAALLLQKGMDHEAAVLDAYRAEGKTVFEVPAQDKEHGESFAAWVERVGNPMADGHDVVFQMPFVHDGIRGIADFLVRTVDPDTGTVTYEPVDAKLARNAAKPGHVLQLCFYAEALGALTGARPTHVRIALGSGQVETIRVSDVLPYWRRLRGQLAKLVEAPPTGRHVPRAVRPLPVLPVRDGVRGPVARRPIRSSTSPVSARPIGSRCGRATSARSPASPSSTARSPASTRAAATGSSARPSCRSPPARTPTTRRRSSC